MSLLIAILYYIFRVALFTATAAAGIAIGIKWRKAKNKKEAETSKN